MGLNEFLKNRSTKTGYVAGSDPDIVDLDFNIMKQDYENGVQIGESTGIKEMDTNLSWMRGHQNCWTGWANDGKSTFSLYMMTVKSLLSGWRWVIWSPEMKKANFIDGKVKKNYNVLAYEIMGILSGKTPYQHIHLRYGVPLLSIDRIHFLKEWINKHFVFVDPAQRDIKYIMEMHKRIYEKYGFDGFFLDPYKNIKAELDKREDQHLHDTFAEVTDVSIETNTSFNWIAHPKGNVSRLTEVNGQTRVAPCNQYMLSGGSAWDNSMDGIFTPLRPYSCEDLADNRVEFHNLKQRMQDLTASKGVVEGITYNIRNKRYYFGDRDPLMNIIERGDKLIIDSGVSSQFPVSNKLPNPYDKGYPEEWG